MAIFYPRKQTVIIFVVSIVVVSSVAYYTSSQRTALVTAEKNGSVALAAAISATSSIIDDPRYANWRAQFEGTVKVPSQKTASSSPTKLTDTDNLSRDFFAHYVELKQANLLTNQDVVNQTAQDLVTSHMNTTPSKIYTVSDLKVTGTDKASIAAFSQAVARVLNSYSVTKNETVIIQSYLSNNDAKVLKGLDPIITTYRRMLAGFVSIPVPANLAAPYLELLNAVNTLQFGAIAMRASDNDTVRGLSGVSARANGQAALITALTDLHQAILQAGGKFEFEQTILNGLLK